MYTERDQRERASSLAKTVPFGRNTTATSWLPNTPRDAPYVDHFQPTPKDKWMTGLRVESAKQNKIDFYSKKDDQPKKRYYNKTGPSPALIAKR